MIYELRVYQIAPGKMETLHRVFKETVVPLFEQYGIKIVGFWEPIGCEVSNPPHKMELHNPMFPLPGQSFAYMVAFESEAQREKIWPAFEQDPQLGQVLELVNQDGAPWQRIDATVLKPTDYSPLS